MNLPTHLQQAVEQWANRQGISAEQFIIYAVTDKIDCLSQQLEPTTEAPHRQLEQQPILRRKQGLLVVDAEWPDHIDVNDFIDELRAERIQEQMVL